LMMSLWDALRMNMMISYQELVRTFLSLCQRASLPAIKALSSYQRLHGVLFFELKSSSSRQ
ncbi:hypothetical protein, partial [Klebsiella pneumoniae]|uniref:hypothetical protein n=1 Tax=Klebsiella pneumoniae TaxID=573 RepID=UPI001F194993